MSEGLRVGTEVAISSYGLSRCEKVEGEHKLVPRNYLIINFAKRSSN